MTERPEVLRGEVWRVSLDPTIGSEIRKARPCVVLQRDAANRTSPTTVVCAISDARGRESGLTNIAIPAGEAGLTKPSIVVCNQIRTVDRTRFQERLGVVPASVLHEIERGVCAILDL